MEQKVIVFLDNIQRTIIATQVAEDSHTITVIKPAILNVVPADSKKLQVQLYPLLFREFLKNRDVFPTWTYSKATVAISNDITLEPNILGQYVEMFKIVPNEGAPTIKLFDTIEEKK